jgi:hypothetical protein
VIPIATATIAATDMKKLDAFNVSKTSVSILLVS